MAEDKGKEEEKFDFTTEGEGYISLGEARVVAVRTTLKSPGNYGRQYPGTVMVFEVAESGEDDDYYTVTLSVRPQRNFNGTSGQEQLVRKARSLSGKFFLTLSEKVVDPRYCRWQSAW